MLNTAKIMIAEVHDYLKESLSINISTRQWNAKNKLPHYLSEPYTYYQTNILDIDCILIVSLQNEEATPSNIRKHIDKLKEVSNHQEVIFVTQKMTSYNRQRLVQQRVPFIIPKKQMYLPPLGVDFKEHFNAVKTPIETFKPSTQVVLLHLLMKANKNVVRPVDCIKPYEYAAMTISRAFNEIEEKEICPVTTKGRERILQIIPSKKEIWGRSLPLLKTPVAIKHHISLLAPTMPVIKAGLTALAQYSNLQEPANAIYAMSKRQWKVFCKETDFQEVHAGEPGSCTIEVWNYDPGFFSDKNKVDPFSLYLSLLAETDERTRDSLDHMIRNVAW